MNEPYAIRLWIVRKRLLILAAVFFVCGIALIALGKFASNSKGDPGAVVYLIPVLIAAEIGLIPTILYLRDRWSKSLEVTHCPKCEQFIWGNVTTTLTIAVFPNCPYCLKRLEDPARSIGQP